MYAIIFFSCRATPAEVPRLGVESELQLWAYATAIAAWDPSRICDLHTAHGNPGSPTHGARPGIEPTSSQILIGFISAVPQGELPYVVPFLNNSNALSHVPAITGRKYNDKRHLFTIRKINLVL